MKKSYKIILIVLGILVFLFVFDKVNESLHLDLMEKFTENYNYYPIKKENQFVKSYYGEYLDSFERMWYQYEELNFINDSTFQIVTNSTYFLDYLFPEKYYLGMLDFSKWESLAQERFVLRNTKVYKLNSDSLVGIIKKEKDRLIFKYQRQ